MCYALAFVLVVLYVAGVQGFLPTALRQGVFFLLQKGTLAVALFAVVMLIGVLPLDSKMRRYIAPIRAELSIIACILACGHMAAYAMSYVPRVLSSGAIAPLVAAGLVAALALAVLLVVLGATSFNAVKARMSKQSWVRLQKWAYAFYALIYVHVLAMLLPSALAGGAAAAQAVAVYTLVFGAYAVLRVFRVLQDRR